MTRAALVLCTLLAACTLTARRELVIEWGRRGADAGCPVDDAGAPVH